MRVTNKSLYNDYMMNLNRNLQGMKKYQNQLASGKEILRPSDGPFKVIRAMGYDTAIKQSEQHLKNIDYARGWVQATDTALQSTVKALRRVRDLTEKGANGTNAPEDREAIADEVKQIIGQIADIGNTNYDGRYILGGQNTLEPPFEVNVALMANANGDGLDIIREISPEVTLEVNVTSDEYFGGISEDLGATLKNVYDRLISGDSNGLSNDSLEKVDEHIDKFLGLLAEVGAKENRLDAAYSKNELETSNMKELLSKTEDIDFAEKIMQYAMMESVYKAALSSGGRILQPTLLNYLR